MIPASKVKGGSHKDRWEALVDKYFALNFDKVATAKAMGYKHPHSAISQIFRHPTVVSLIQQRQERNKRKHELNEDWIISRLMKIADASLGDVMLALGPDDDLSALTDEQRYALSEFKVEVYTEGKGKEAREVKRTVVKLNDKLAALRDLGRHLGLFTDKVELGASDDLVRALQAGRQRVFGEPVDVEFRALPAPELETP